MTSQNPLSTLQYFLSNTDGIYNLNVQEAPLAPLKANEVLVRIHAVSLNYRDIAITSGHYPFQLKPNLVPCSDMAGEVVAIGEDVKCWKQGDRVCANFCMDHVFGDITPEHRKSVLGGAVDGVLARYRNFPAHSLVRVPDHLSYQEASTLPCAGVTAYNALVGPVSPLKAGETVLILGTGGVSMFGLQFAIASGATVLVTSSSDEKLKVAEKMGAKFCINYVRTPEWDEEVLKLTGGWGVDHVLEVGGAGTLPKSMKSVRSGGWIHVIGVLTGPKQVDDIVNSMIGKASYMRGIGVGPRTQFESMNRLISAQNLKPVVNRVFAFDEARQAFEYLKSQKHIGKVVIKVTDD
ncbi:hypothetical protein JAAARDRAFT_59442 [Jaapia argillacea MUCL 33604]|uniref:Enoyl reductase (ER) domain-containing protein n=1 Tax=Jaapia argillacea MUCL 33604 TaxID=933084 RepID=A0A067PMF6_9AGAM|nr:hypothetical protein JAAARDRAFT_59442 [Jaapia argillacea MUCL 33604]